MGAALAAHPMSLARRLLRRPELVDCAASASALCLCAPITSQDGSGVASAHARRAQPNLAGHAPQAPPKPGPASPWPAPSSQPSPCLPWCWPLACLTKRAARPSAVAEQVRATQPAGLLWCNDCCQGWPAIPPAMAVACNPSSNNTRLPWLRNPRARPACAALCVLPTDRRE